ncbi:MAG: hypothetical protein KAX84_03600, partial [Burkholderiales bacterium]|nr:hypothetical protein [Burkholderiales bacterium]
GGIFKTPFDEGYASTPAVLPDGGLLIPGYHVSKHMVMKLAASGVPDAAFGVDGVAEMTHGVGYSAVGAAVQADGRIVVALRLKLAHGVWRLAAMRLNPDGSADLTYGVNGLSVIASDVTEVTYGMALAPDGKLWLFGRADLTAADSGLALARLLGTEITSSVVEFYNTGLDHYFVTADPNEAAAIDAGAAGPGWNRTGQAWKSGGPNRVCRFYGSPDIVAATGLRRGPNSHFYTIEAAECAVVKDDMGWQFESHDFNGWPVPAGGCPAETVAIRRVYNNGFKQNDSNHRYVTSVALYDEMTRLGWTGEGTVFCAVR